jgi:hypothetical protein
VTALNFPNSPTAGTTFTSGDTKWVYTGATWALDYADTIMRDISLNTKTVWKSFSASADASNGWQYFTANGQDFNVSFTKLYSSSISSVVVTMNVSSYHSSLNQAKFGVYGLGGDEVKEIIHAFHNASYTHAGWSATKEILGIPAGTYNVKAYWYTNAGTLYCDGNDSQSFTIREKLLV